MRSAVFADEASALAACAKIDAHLGYPKDEPDQLGRMVRCERFTEPLALDDGTFAVQLDDAIATGIKLAKSRLAERDLRSLRRQTDDAGNPIAPQGKAVRP